MKVWLVKKLWPKPNLKSNFIANPMSDPKNQNQISIELNEETAQGVYSNLAVITHSASEFVIDFVRIMPGIPKAQVKSRIILTPEHAKRLVAALEDNIDKYESVHGTIKEIKGSGPVMPLNFGGPTAQA
jgi:Protein of unknown function (DUF3467)